MVGLYTGCFSVLGRVIMFREESEKPVLTSVVVLCPGDADVENLSGWDVICGEEGPVLLASSLSVFEERTTRNRSIGIDSSLEVKKAALSEDARSLNETCVLA